MLMEFRVKGFKNFKDEVCLDLAKTKNYEFSLQAVRDGLVNTGLIYGINGSGKTNLGYAILELTLHLTDREKPSFYRNYINLESDDPADFFYKFKFGDSILIYHYQKLDQQLLVFEEVIINDEKVISCDHVLGKAKVKLDGAENLKTNIHDNTLSFVKYVARNTLLKKNKTNVIFNDFISYVEKMLFFSSESNEFQGYTNGSNVLEEAIVNAGKLEDFQGFLKTAGINYHLVAKEVEGEIKILCRFKSHEKTRYVSFFSIASRGTKALAIFYYWLIRLEEVSFVYIDEFDAFYHTDLSRRIVETILNLRNPQCILSSHNTNIMDNDLLRPDCYFQIVDGQVRSFAESADREIRYAHNLQKMYNSGAFVD